MDDNPYEAPSTTTSSPDDGVDTQRFHLRDYLSAGCSFVVVFPLVLILLGGVVAGPIAGPFRVSSLMAAVVTVGVFATALVLASLSAWQALYQARRRRLRRVGRMKTAGKPAR